MKNGVLNIPNNPIIHYIEGDGIGVDITPVMMKVVDSAVEMAYQGQKKIQWSEVLAGEKAFNATCLLYTSPSPRDRTRSRMPSSA